MLVKRVAGSYAKKTRDYVIGAAREAFVAGKQIQNGRIRDRPRFFD